LTAENAIFKAAELREVLGQVLKIHAPHSDVLVKDDWKGHLKRLQELAIISQNGDIAGIPTGLPHLDHHWGGLQGEASYVVLGRPGDAKSMTLVKMAVTGAWNGHRMGFFSPEMTEHQHRCRIYTMLSAIPEIQKACGLRAAFRNRALREGHGFNMKTYKRFLEYIEEEMVGEIVILTQKYRREKMSASYIESRVEDLGLEAIFVDPIYKLRPPRHRGNKWEELAEITDSLVDIAHGFNIPVVMSNQANRALVGKRGDAPDKDSSFGSDAPVQEADTVIGVKHYSEERLMKFSCTKNRHGEPFKFSARFLPNIGVMDDVTPLTGDYYNGYDPEKVQEISDEVRKELMALEAKD
jgi:replicative DNA helicase